MDTVQSGMTADGTSVWYARNTKSILLQHERGYGMDNRYFDLIARCEDCVILANALARYANYSKDAESYSTPRLHNLLTMVGNVEQQLMYEVHMQTGNDICIHEIVISK